MSLIYTAHQRLGRDREKLTQWLKNTLDRLVTHQKMTIKRTFTAIREEYTAIGLNKNYLFKFHHLGDGVPKVRTKTCVRS